MMRRTVLLLVVLVAAGCGAESDRVAVESPVVSIPPARVTTKIVGATPKQRQALREVIAGLGPTTVESVEFRELEDDMGAAENAVALYVKAPNDDRFARWHAHLIGDVFYQRSRELGLPPVAWLGTESHGHALGPWSARDARSRELSLAEAREVANRIRTAAAANDADVLRLELIRPRRLGFVVVLRAADPATFLLLGYEDITRPVEELRGRGYDGRFIEVLDGDGEFVMSAGGEFRVREKFAGCAPVLVSGGMSYRPPPCPAKRHWLVD